MKRLIKTKRQHEILELLANGWTLKRRGPNSFYLVSPKRLGGSTQVVTHETLKPLIDAGEVEVQS